MSSVSPGGADLVPTTPDWPAWVGFMVTTHFDLVSGPFHSPIFIRLHSVSTSANMYHLHTRAGELPRTPRPSIWANAGGSATRPELGNTFRHIVECRFLILANSVQLF